MTLSPKLEQHWRQAFRSKVRMPDKPKGPDPKLTIFNGLGVGDPTPEDIVRWVTTGQGLWKPAALTAAERAEAARKEQEDRDGFVLAPDDYELVEPSW